MGGAITLTLGSFSQVSMAAPGSLDTAALARINELSNAPPYSQREAPRHTERPPTTFQRAHDLPAELPQLESAVEEVDYLAPRLSYTSRRPALNAIRQAQRQRSLVAYWWGELDIGIQLPEGIADDEVWVHISVDRQSLTLMRGNQKIDHIDYVAFGAAGASPLRKRGSRLTPIGDFRIDHINPQSQYHHFFRIDYPNPAVAERALSEGKINQQTHDYIVRYYERHGRAPMDTPLGGHLGLHGLGNKDPFLHRRTQWTDGCTAVTNEDIDRLKPWLALGTRVIIE